MHFTKKSTKKVKDMDRNKRTKVDPKSDFLDESSSLYWNVRAQYKLRDQLAKEQNENIAKNVIFFLGDGMSIPTVTAARIYWGQSRGYSGEESRLSFEKFPYIGLSKVRATIIVQE